jgi:ketosteroid isomerase-like protein
MDTAAIDSALDAATARVSRGFETGQVDSVAALFTEDHFSMPPNQPAISGRSQWLAWSKAALVGGQWTSVATSESRLYGDSVTVDRGRYVNTFVPAPDAPKTRRAVSDTGKYVWIWRKTGEGWRLAAAIWNSNAAPTP